MKVEPGKWPEVDPTPATADGPDTPTDPERRDLLETLARHRGFLRQTVQGVSDADAARRTTVSELCLGGLIKHVTLVEQNWADILREAIDGAKTMG